MATDVRVVVPDDLGLTIRMGAKIPNKYDIDVSQLDLPSSVTQLTLQNGVLTAVTTDGANPSVDLKPMLPAMAKDLLLKSVTREGTEIVFTVGGKTSKSDDTQLRVDVSDLLPVQADGVTITGDGTVGDKLSVQVSAVEGNLLTKEADGLAVKPLTIEQAVKKATSEIPSCDTRLVNATGQTTLGYICSFAPARGFGSEPVGVVGEDAPSYGVYDG